MNLRLAMGLPVLLVSAFCALAACHPTFEVTPCPTCSGPTATGAAHRGLAVNNANEVGFAVAEKPIASFSYAGDALDASTSEIVVDEIGPGPKPIAVSQCYLSPRAALTASNTQYAEIDVYKRSSDAGSPVLVASASTVITQSVAGSDGGATGNWTAFTHIPLTMVANSSLTPGDLVTFLDTKVGGGIVLAQFKISCYPTIN